MEDTWVPTVCYGCYNACGVLARRVDGVVTDIGGDPENPSSLGHICAKGKARIADLYDPQRVMRPLRRRNPEKGIGVDPQWEEITWEEALQLVAERLTKARNKDPRRVVVAHFDLRPNAPHEQSVKLSQIVLGNMDVLVSEVDEFCPVLVIV